MRLLMLLSLGITACSIGPVPCPSVDAGARTETFDASLPDAGHVLWVGAHPDDEAMAAPLLGTWCQRQGLHCTFIVLTKGEAGTCAKADGCSPDLGSVRAAEMQASASSFNAALIQRTLPNTTLGTVDQVQLAWTQFSGSQDAFIETVASVMRTTNFDQVVTFDPRHGSTCHPEHRIAGALTLSAADRVGLARSKIILLGSNFGLTQDGNSRPCQLGFLPVVQADLVKTLDASAHPERWADFVHTLTLHPSQFAQPMVDAASAAPEGWKALDLLRASDANDSDAAWLNLCSQ